MRWAFGLILLASGAAAQINAEPQYQLTGKNYSTEAAAIQQMFYNNAGTFQSLQTEINALAAPAVVTGSTVAVNSPLSGNGSSVSPLSVVGISSTCATGSYLNGAVLLDGVAQGGTCTVVPTGGTGISTGAITDATMGGNGNSSAPLGVNFSTITTALAGKAATFTGISSSCAAGFYLSTATVTNGVLTGGGCVAAGGSATGISTGVVTNATLGGNGNSAEVLGVNFSTITTQFLTVALATASFASGGATTYLHVDGSNYMTGQFLTLSSATIRGSGGLLVTNQITTKGGPASLNQSAAGSYITQATQSSFDTIGEADQNILTGGPDDLGLDSEIGVVIISNGGTEHLRVGSTAVTVTDPLVVTSTVTVGGYSGIPHADTYARLKAAAVVGTPWFAYATDLQEFVFYTGNVALGDKGWVLQ